MFLIRMLSRITPRIALGLAAAALWALTAGTPAHAQTSACSCPRGSILIGNLCSFGTFAVPAACVGPNPTALGQSVGHLAASAQQLSFASVEAILEARRDQLQGTLGAGKKPLPMGYVAPAFEDLPDGSGALGYAGSSKRANPLAAMPTKAPAPANTGPSYATWLQGVGDWEHDEATSADDVSHFASIYAAQGGADATWQNLSKAGDALVVGLFGSYTSAYVGYDGTPTTTKLRGPGVGVYETYVNGGFSADLTGKVDFLGLVEDFANILPTATLNVTNAGAAGNVQYKIELMSGGFVEPTGGFSFTRTMFGTGADVLGLTDASTLRLQAGARFGTTWNNNGTSIEPSLKTLVYSNVIAEGSSSTNTALVGIVPTDQGKIRGQIEPSLNLDFGNGTSATLTTSVRFGQGMLGGTASINLRRQW